MNFPKEKSTYKHQTYDLPKIIKLNAPIFFGSGGSSNITIIHDNIAIKLIPEHNKFPLDKIKPNHDQLEILHYKLFTTDLILTHITPHIVGYYNHYKLINIEPILPTECPDIDKILLVDPTQINKISEKLCFMKQKLQNKIFMPKADILILELCPTTIEKEVNAILEAKTEYKSLTDFVDEYEQLISFIHLSFITSINMFDSTCPLDGIIK